MKKALGLKVKILSVLFCAVLLGTFFPLRANAVEALELHMEGILKEDSGLQIYCNTNAETMPQAGDFSATLGNTVLTVQNVATIADNGTSYVFLVDVSGSIKEAYIQAIKDTIKTICAGLAEKDNISVFTIGDHTYTQSFVSGGEDIEAQIDAIERSREDTNLYKGIYDSLAILKTHESCRDKKVLVVFSDGEDDIVEGITLNEVIATVTDSRIPVYTVAMLGTNPADRYVESAKVLGSFARQSAGGRHYTHTIAEGVSGEIAADILRAVQNGLILTADLAGFSSNGEDMRLRLELSVAGVGNASDSYTISTMGLSVPNDETEETEETPETDEADAQGEEETETAPAPETAVNYAYIIAGVIAALALTGIVLFAVRRRKKPGETSSSAAAIIPLPAAESETVQLAKAPPAPVKPRIALRLTKIGPAEEQVFRAEFAEELVIGRNPDAATLPFKDDLQLSARHCSISYEAEGVVLRDLGSTNGTFVNGVPVKDKYVLENDDILLIGSMELRVNWENM